MPGKLKFNVFGRMMFVERQQGKWLLFRDSGTGVRSLVNDVVIPENLAESELLNYLDDIYHERASEDFTAVIQISEL